MGMEEAKTENPFIAAQLFGGAVGAAEASVQRYMRSGYMDDLAGKGKPLPYRPPPPFVDPVEHRLQGVVDRMTQERPELEEGEWRAAVTKSSIQHIRQEANRGSKTGIK